MNLGTTSFASFSRLSKTSRTSTRLQLLLLLRCLFEIHFPIFLFFRLASSYTSSFVVRWDAALIFYNLEGVRRAIEIAALRKRPHCIFTKTCTIRTVLRSLPNLTHLFLISIQERNLSEKTLSTSSPDLFFRTSSANTKVISPCYFVFQHLIDTTPHNFRPRIYAHAYRLFCAENNEVLLRYSSTTGWTVTPYTLSLPCGRLSFSREMRAMGGWDGIDLSSLVVWLVGLCVFALDFFSWASSTFAYFSYDGPNGGGGLVAS